jgi:hypothetical protein
MSESQKRPVKSLGPVWTGAGCVEVAVWANSSDNRTKHSVTWRRTYKVDGNWKETQSLFEGDLLPLARLLERAWEWIVTQQPPKEGTESAERTATGSPRSR